MKFVICDTEGFPLQYFESDLTPVPEAAHALSEEVWQDLINHSGCRKIVGGEVVVTDPPAAPGMPLLPLSPRQFAQGLALAGHITEEEAEEWVGPGTVPAALLDLVANLPGDEQFAARMLLRGATSFEHTHPLTAALAASYGWTPQQTDQFWRDCALL
ncbi:MAG TPA: hypothetical protein VIU82_10355 [Bosea sp. (in: a-proteobacteria)]